MSTTPDAEPPGPTLFLGAHPDDETIAMGVAIAHAARAGHDVHVAWLTAGTSSAVRDVLNGVEPSDYWGTVRHDPAAEGYEPLDADAFGRARLTEANNALRQLATGYPGSVTIHGCLDLIDGQVTVDDAQSRLAALCRRIAGSGPIRLRTHTWRAEFDEHPDHVAAGTAARNLQTADPQTFPDVRYYVLPDRWATVENSAIEFQWERPEDNGVAARLVNACRAYNAWSPPLTFAIGYHSVPEFFDQLLARPGSLFHS
jgi:N-acetyl-1-D-myo-inositol-2-amino-2-deoxy-alpha-D-glucopyranoside deacetylase